jgi:hypothetical protein
MNFEPLLIVLVVSAFQDCTSLDLEFLASSMEHCCCSLVARLYFSFFWGNGLYSSSDSRHVGSDRKFRFLSITYLQDNCIMVGRETMGREA